MIDTDVLVIGSGFAGLWAAIAAREAGVAHVAVVDKGAIGMSSQSKLSAGATVYCLPEDDADAWVREYAEVQGYLSRQDMVADILGTSHSRLRKLESWGIAYQRTRDGGEYFRLPSRGFRHVKMLVLPQWGKRVGGAAVVAALRNQAARLRVSKHPRILITALLQRNGRVAGAVGVDRSTGETKVFKAGAVILAAADCSFRGNYACADAVTGDAFRLAYDAGVRLTNLEFLCVNTGPLAYGFEGTGIALRFGGKLVDASGQPFMHRYHPEGDAAEVNYLVQAMAKEVEAGSGPPFFLDLRGSNNDFLKVALASMGGFMPLNIERLKGQGIDIFEQPQEWVPAVQTLRGGVRTNLDCMSDLPGLFAAGLSQAVDPGLFNGWSSMRAMWAGERAGTAAATFVKQAGAADPMADDVAWCEALATTPLRHRGGCAPDATLSELHRTLFPYGVCILKREDRLRAALAAVEALRDGALAELCAADPHELAKAHETCNIVRVAEMFLRASLARTESRGDHYRADFPAPDNRNWLQWVTVRKGDYGAMVLDTEPVPLSQYPFRPDAVGNAQ